MPERRKGPDPLPNQMSFRSYLVASEKLGVKDEAIVAKYKYLGEAGGTSDWHENFELEETHRQIDILNIQASTWRPAVLSPEIIEPRIETDNVQLGNKVEFELVDFQENLTFTMLGSIDQLLFPDEAISTISPIGMALVGLRAGEVGEYETPDGKARKVRVIKISPGDF